MISYDYKKLSLKIEKYLIDKFINGKKTKAKDYIYLKRDGGHVQKADICKREVFN